MLLAFLSLLASADPGRFSGAELAKVNDSIETLGASAALRVDGLTVEAGRGRIQARLLVATRYTNLTPREDELGVLFGLILRGLYLGEHPQLTTDDDVRSWELTLSWARENGEKLTSTYAPSTALSPATVPAGGPTFVTTGGTFTPETIASRRAQKGGCVQVASTGSGRRQWAYDAAGEETEHWEWTGAMLTIHRVSTRAVDRGRIKEENTYMFAPALWREQQSPPTTNTGTRWFDPVEHRWEDEGGEPVSSEVLEGGKVVGRLNADGVKVSGLQWDGDLVVASWSARPDGVRARETERVHERDATGRIRRVVTTERGIYRLVNQPDALSGERVTTELLDPDGRVRLSMEVTDGKVDRSVVYWHTWTCPV